MDGVLTSFSQCVIARLECLVSRFKARMSGVTFCAEEVIVDVLRLSVVFCRRYFIYLLGLRQ